ncbi:MAG: LytTR family transcriptional regulator [Bacteroidetes bacterium]|nr:LytTR family transcriptional regulator [Bacteroidota bacterium]
MALFTAMTFLLSLLNEFILRPLFFQKVTYQRIIIWSIWTFVLLGLANFWVYNIQGNWHDFHLRSAFEFIINCSTVYIFPLAGTFFFYRYHSLQQQFHQELIHKQSTIDPDQLISFVGQGANDRITLSLEDFIYAQSQDNYVELNYLVNGKLSKMLIRVSISQLAETVGNASIVRCHRSFLVNLFHVRSITGNSNGHRLQLNNIEKPIPVSKSYQKETMAFLEQVKNLA